MIKRLRKHNSGQGLVEYALVLVLVSVVVIGILTILGPQVGNVFSRVVDGLGGASSSAAANPPQNQAMVTNILVQTRSNDIVFLKVTVSENTKITLSDSQGGNSVTVNCNGSCLPQIIVGGSAGGTITATAPANYMSVGYGPG
jgi:pilus assembly protein Flp/PilA